jgi:hypothetical protein
MFSNFKMFRSLMILTLIGLVVALLPATSTQAKDNPDFALTINFQSPPHMAHLVRGGLPASQCPVPCTTDVEPRYQQSSFGVCYFDSNSIGVVSLNDFSGTVTLEMLNLPAGVTSQTATSLTVPRRQAVSTPFKLQAVTNATLGTATITIRATSGSIVKTLTHEISVADALPAC